MMGMLPKTTNDQIRSIPIDCGSPIIISDADEVLVVFMARFESFLKYHGNYFNWSSFKLTGNVRRLSDDYIFSQKEVFSLLDNFFETETATLDAVPGANEALQYLSSRAQIIILSNVPAAYHTDRKICLTKHGMDYPLIVNSGPKGPAVKAISGKTHAPTFFIDDSPANITSVANAANHVRRIHFVHDPRLAKLIGPAPDSHYRSDFWVRTKNIIDEELTAAGF